MQADIDDCETARRATGYHNCSTVDLIGQGLLAGFVGFCIGALVVSSVSEGMSNEPLYRKHMIRNNIAEWVINQDGKNVLVLKGNRDYEKAEKAK